MRDANWRDKVKTVPMQAPDCLLCNRTGQFIGVYMPFAGGAKVIYGLCDPCADLPDCIARVDEKLLVKTPGAN